MTTDDLFCNLVQFVTAAEMGSVLHAVILLATFGSRSVGGDTSMEGHTDHCMLARETGCWYVLRCDSICCCSGCSVPFVA